MLAISSFLAIVHAVLGVFVTDTPAWLAAKGRHSDALTVSRSLDCAKDIEVMPSASSGGLENDSEVHTSLLSEPESPEAPVGSSSLVPPETVGILRLLAKPDLRRAVLIVSAAMIAQQGSGINAGQSSLHHPLGRIVLKWLRIVIYYSTDILKKVLTADAALISVVISVVNVVMTFAPVILVGV